MQGAVAVGLAPEPVEQVQQPGVDGADVACPVVAHDVVDGLQGFREVAPVGAITDVQPLVGMGVVKAQVPARFRMVGGAGLGAQGRQNPGSGGQQAHL